MKRRLVQNSFFCCFLASTIALADDGKAPLSAPVKVLSTTSAAEQPAANARMVMPQPAPPQPTTPGGKLPQYQLDHQHRTVPSAAEWKDPRLRLILALPDAPVLIEAAMTIDGQPFRMAREQRIRQLLEAATTVPRVGAEAAVAPQPTVEEQATQVNGEDEPNADENEPDVAPSSRPTSVSDRLRRYIAATGQAASPDEVRWLLANWIDGPTVLMLNENFQRFRANQRPVFHLLDRDRDGAVSAKELERAVEAFNECDLNRNQIVEYTEIAKVAADPRLKQARHAGPGKLLFLVPDKNSAAATYRRIASRYATAHKDETPLVPRFDHNSNGRFDDEELQALRTAPPDLSFTIAFDTAQPDKSRIELTAADPSYADAVANGSVAASALLLRLGGTTVSFSALQAGSSDQISIGAVNDGYPILPAVDPNEDGRFTIRELRELLTRLKSFDRNRDGALTADETQSTIRVCFSLGPHVHQELAGLRRLNPQPQTPAVTGPEWFVRMDRNKDNDLTRAEFPGNDDQFAELDADGDKLVSAEEANDFDRKSGNSQTDSSEQPAQATDTPPTETD